jgi:hypothetical protein
MNERIRELAVQARITISGYTDDNSGYYEPSGSSPEELEKFAELIVAECAHVAKHHVMNISTYGDAEFVAEQINQHFGV